MLSSISPLSIMHPPFPSKCGWIPRSPLVLSLSFLSCWQEVSRELLEEEAVVTKARPAKRVADMMDYRRKSQSHLRMRSWRCAWIMPMIIQKILQHWKIGRNHCLCSEHCKSQHWLVSTERMRRFPGLSRVSSWRFVSNGAVGSKSQQASLLEWKSTNAPSLRGFASCCVCVWGQFFSYELNFHWRCRSDANYLKSGCFGSGTHRGPDFALVLSGLL